MPPINILHSAKIDAAHHQTARKRVPQAVPPEIIQYRERFRWSQRMNQPLQFDAVRIIAHFEKAGFTLAVHPDGSLIVQAPAGQRLAHEAIVALDQHAVELAADLRRRGQISEDDTGRIINVTRTKSGDLLLDPEDREGARRLSETCTAAPASDRQNSEA